jgi:hypothetical protein
MPTAKFAKAVVATVVVASLLWASGVTPAIVPNNVPTANKQGNTGTKFFLCTGAFTAGNVVSTDASGNCVDSGGTGGGAGFTVYSGLAGITISGGVTAYFPFGGGSIASTTEADVTVNLRAAATVSSFTSHLSAALGGPGNTVVFTLRKNAGDTAITCTVTDPAVECSDTVNSVTFATGDTIDIKAVFTGTIAVTPNFVLGAVVGVASSPLVSSVFGQTGTVDIPVTTTDIATPANPGAGTTRWYTKAGTLCALDPSGTETCTGTGSGVTVNPPYVTISGSTYGPVFAITRPILTDFTSFASTGSTTVTDTGAGITITGTGTGGIGYYKTGPGATPFNVTTVMLTTIGPEDFGAAFMLGRNSATGLWIRFGIQHDTSRLNLEVHRMNADNTFNSTTANIALSRLWAGNGPLFLRISDDGTNRREQWSADGVNFSTFLSETRTTWTTCDQFGFVTNGSTNYGANTRIISYTQ